MKNIFSILMLLGVILSGCSYSHLPHKTGENIIQHQSEDEEYELLIFDAGFQSWFAAHAKPVSFYSPEYYRTHNQRYVTTWNALHLQYGGRSPFENLINYDPNTNYGLALDYQLFWYFKYIESLYGNLYSFPGAIMAF